MIIVLLHQQQYLPNYQHVAKFKYSYDYIRKTVFDFMDDKKTKKSLTKKNRVIPEARHAVFCIDMMHHPRVR